MPDPDFRTSICSVVFVDIVDYSKAAVDRQVAMKADLNDAIRSGLTNAPEDELIVLDAGDGAAICFFGDPEDALFAATAISATLRGKLRLRTGINLGPVKIVTDLNGNRNVVGDAINVAQRIMSFADEQEVLISRPYFEVVSCLRDENTFSFRSLGVRKDKHIREHEVYAVGDADEKGRRLAETTFAAAPAVPAIDPDLPDDLVDKCRRHLMQVLGPMAGVIVRRTVAEARSAEDFVGRLAEKIDSEADRRAFRAAVGQAAKRSDRPVEEPVVEEIPDDGAGEGDGPVDDPLIARATEQLAAIIGPIAVPLVRRAATTACTSHAFLAVVAGHIEDEPARRRFLEAMIP